MAIKMNNMQHHIELLHNIKPEKADRVNKYILYESAYMKLYK